MSDGPKEVTQAQFETIKAVLGIDAETFRRTKIGQYIFDRIDVQEDKLIEELIAADPFDNEKGVKIRSDIAMHRMLPKFIAEAIGEGRAAEQNLEKMEGYKDY